MLIPAYGSPDLIMCRRQPGIGALYLAPGSSSSRAELAATALTSRSLLLPALPAIGRLCEKCDGKCPICDS